MKITVIYGTMRKQSTYNIARKFIDKLSCGDKVLEFFLPKDAPNFCNGCFSCFEGRICPHKDYINPIAKAMDEANLIIFASPVYVYHVSGQLKTLLDHLGYRWMVHRPSKSMFKKQVLVISTAAGAGCKSTNKDVLDSCFFWGVSKTYSYGLNVFASCWNGVSEKLKEKIDKDVEKISEKIKNQSKVIKPSIKVRGFFNIMRIMHKKNKLSDVDTQYWKEKGWLNNKRPWK